jgi:hypothetical protein
LGISSEYVNNNRKDSMGSTTSIKEQVTNATTAINDPPTTETAMLTIPPIEKVHTRSMSLVHLNELIHQIRPSEPPALPSVDGGDELNETSFRDADDNYQCLINDQNCPPASSFSKASTPGIITSENANNNNNSSTLLTTITNKDEGIVFTTQTSITNKNAGLDNVERYKMCGNSII